MSLPGVGLLRLPPVGTTVWAALGNTDLLPLLATLGKNTALSFLCVIGTTVQKPEQMHLAHALVCGGRCGDEGGGWEDSFLEMSRLRWPSTLKGTFPGEESEG